MTEFYLYGEDGKRIIGEVENIGPGITRELVLKVEPGSYITACKPGMAGDGLRAPFSVSDSGEEQGSAGTMPSWLSRRTRTTANTSKTRPSSWCR